MAEPIVISSNIYIPASALVQRATRSGGPGGQNVNKVASKVELHVDLAAIVGLNYFQRQRLLVLCEGRLDSQGRLMMVSAATREQSRNLEDARDKVRALIGHALVVPKRRVATKPTRGSKERRIQEKKRQGDRKRSRNYRADGGD